MSTLRRLALLLCLVAPAARAESARLVLVDPDPELEAAVRASLAAWSTAIVVERVTGPGNTMPGSADRARQLSRMRRSEAVVWISRAEDGVALWMYDARSDRVVARRLETPPPLDEATAAAAALAIKTLLRHSDVPPPTERVEEPAPAPWLRAAPGLGVRPNATTVTYLEQRLAIGGTVWPRLVSPPFELGFGAEVAIGPGVPVEVRGFAGRWTETALLLDVRGRAEWLPKLDVTLSVGAGLGFSELDGVVQAPSQMVDVRRVTPMIGLHVEQGYRASRVLRPAIRLQVTRPFRTQSYLVRGEPVVSTESVTLSALIVLETGLF